MLFNAVESMHDCFLFYFVYNNCSVIINASYICRYTDIHKICSAFDIFLVIKSEFVGFVFVKSFETKIKFLFIKSCSVCGYENNAFAFVFFDILVAKNFVFFYIEYSV